LIQSQTKILDRLKVEFCNPIQAQEGIEKLKNAQKRELRMKEKLFKFIDDIQQKTNVVLCLVEEDFSKLDILGQYQWEKDQILMPHPKMIFTTIVRPNLVHKLVHKLNRFTQRSMLKYMIEDLKQKFLIQINETENIEMKVVQTKESQKLYQDYYIVKKSLLQIKVIFRLRPITK